MISSHTPTAWQTRPRLTKLVRLRFVLLAIPFTLLNIIVFSAVHLLFNQLDQTELEAKTRATIEVAVNLSHHDFDTVISNLRFIIRSRELTRYIEGKDYRQDVTTLFYNLAIAYNFFDQIRLLDAHGQELIRIDYEQGTPRVVADSQLQNKSDRYYFIETAKITNDQVYVSPLDLNIENGKVETPYKPMIRFGLPLITSEGQFRGVVIVNYLGNTLLKKFRQQMKLLPVQGNLLNSEGYWLSSPDRSDEWGFMFGRDSTFGTRYPDVWREASASNSGTIETKKGRFFFETIHPMPSIVQSGSTEQAQHNLADWKIIIIGQIFGSDYKLQHLIRISPVFIVFPIGITLIWLWARAAGGRRLAEFDLQALNQTLEDKINLRTAELQATKDVTILSLASLAETRDNETGQHIRRTQLHIKHLAMHLKNHQDFKDQLTDDAIELIYKSAPLHDIGKVGIPDSILLKTGKLTPDEFAQMKRHTIYGSDAIEQAVNTLASSLSIDGSGTFLRYARDIAHYHHERWDGHGYPKGLSGDAIPLAARLMALADVYDALVSKRVYKEAFSREKTEAIILNQSQGHFDPRIVAAFDQIKDKFWQTQLRYAETAVPAHDSISVPENVS